MTVPHTNGRTNGAADGGHTLSRDDPEWVRERFNIPAGTTDGEVTAWYAAQIASYEADERADTMRRRADSLAQGWVPHPAARQAPAAALPALGVCLADVEAEAVRWAWPGWLAVGKLHVFDGDPGMGKSTLLAALAASVTAGQPWPDGSPVPDGARGGVVVLTAEDDPATTIRPRMEAAGADVARVSVVAMAPTLDGAGRIPSFPADTDLILEECRRVGARLLLVDPVTAYLGDVNSHRDSDVRGALAPLAAAAETAGVAGVLVRHLNKSAGGSALYRGGGSIAFAGLARVVWVAGRDPRDQDRRALAVSKNNLAPFPESLGYELVSAGPFKVGKVRWLGPLPLSADDLVRPATADAVTPAQDAAADFLLTALAEGPRAVRELFEEAGAAGISEQTLKRAKRRLGAKTNKRGGVGEPGGWFWSLAESKGASTATVGSLRLNAPRNLAENGDGTPVSAKGIKGPAPFTPLVPFPSVSRCWS